MKKYTRLLLFLFLSILVSSMEAKAETNSLIGSACSRAGETRLDTNKTNIIACLYETDPGSDDNADAPKKWKSMSSGSSSDAFGTSIAILGKATSGSYINTTGKPMAVNVVCSDDINYHRVLIYVDSILEASNMIDAGSGYRGMVSGTVIVPNGKSFSFIEAGHPGPYGCTVVETW